jgi:hypothetical protein
MGNGENAGFGQEALLTQPRLQLNWNSMHFSLCPGSPRARDDDGDVDWSAHSFLPPSEAPSLSPKPKTGEPGSSCISSTAREKTSRRLSLERYRNVGWREKRMRGEWGGLEALFSQLTSNSALSPSPVRARHGQRRAEEPKPTLNTGSGESGGECERGRKGERESEVHVEGRVRNVNGAETTLQINDSRLQLSLQTDETVRKNNGLLICP